jgi:hypothetical protein
MAMTETTMTFGAVDVLTPNAVFRRLLKRSIMRAFSILDQG